MIYASGTTANISAEVNVKFGTQPKSILYLVCIIIAHTLCIIPTYVQWQFLKQCWTWWATTNINVFQSVYHKTASIQRSEVPPRHCIGQSLQRPGYATLQFIYVFLSV